MFRRSKGGAIGLGLLAVIAFPGTAQAAPSTSDNDTDPLRVCSDPNNMPFSNRRKEGFENQIAELMADELGTAVSYTWWPQRRGFLRNTLMAGRCDVVIGIPPVDMIDTTHPYYGSTYVMVSRAEDDLDISSLNAPELEDLTIGVSLIGDDGTNTPPAHALGRRGLTENVVGYPIYGDYREEAPAENLLLALEKGEIDVAIDWGPRAGWFAKHSKVPLTVKPVTGTESYLPLVFQFLVAMGVRKGDVELRDKLDRAIADRQEDIDAILAEYAVPRQ
ncbi:substrate-binding domain-containing protein [Jiella marina]|uniref:substrate-binding domain-containing protein n=1 Tax=Jiella sp. LLJ827 TaxID=2917712 RepID=UPI0021008E12|nr:substrate-binding domain-containing protein [Jiella sp. LLJ827]MCQ0986072.1 substrate-binding domain-containing protein [Jiella sp. LLJ827]